MEALFENFTISVLKLNKLVNRIKQYEMEDYGLQSVHVMCLYYLARANDGIVAGELAKLTLEDKAAISRAVTLLAQKGYVTYDSRKYNTPVRLTEEGKAVAAYIDEKANRAVLAGKDDALTPEQRDAFYASLAVIGKNLQTYYEQLLCERKARKKQR